MEKICDLCGQTFETTLRLQKYCSHYCRARHYRTTHPNYPEIKRKGTERYLLKLAQYCQACGILLRTTRKATHCRDCFNKLNRGSSHPRWKGGRQMTKYGYITLYIPNHPNADSNGQIFEHRFVMAEHLGRPLCPWERVHHKNAIRHDNRLENLLLVLNGHQGKVKCPFCHKEFGIK